MRYIHQSNEIRYNAQGQAVGVTKGTTFTNGRNAQKRAARDGASPRQARKARKISLRDYRRGVDEIVATESICSGL